jgi:excinuclease UvrABC nuclease subunit
LEELRRIKQWRPRYNVMMKRDARHYAFIRLAPGDAASELLESARRNQCPASPASDGRRLEKRLHRLQIARHHIEQREQSASGHRHRHQ